MRNEKGQFVKGHKPTENPQWVSAMKKRRGKPSGMTGKIQSDKARELISQNNARYWLGKKQEHHQGSNNVNWKGGVTKENEKIRKSIQYKQWRLKVFKRDDYTCQICNVRSKKGTYVYLEADHIKPFSLYPDLRFEISNGRTLCKKCHYENGWNLFRNANPRKNLLTNSENIEKRMNSWETLTDNAEGNHEPSVIGI